MIEAAGQPVIRHVLLSRHMRESACCKWMLKATHVTMAAVCVLSLQEKVDRNGIITDDRGVILSMTTSYYISLLDTVCQDSRCSSDTSLITCFVLRYDHILTVHFAGAVRSCTGSSSHMHHRALCLAVHLLGGVAVSDRPIEDPWAGLLRKDRHR